MWSFNKLVSLHFAALDPVTGAAVLHWRIITIKLLVRAKSNWLHFGLQAWWLCLTKYQAELQGKWTRRPTGRCRGWKWQARCVPDVDAEDGLRRRQTIGSGRTLKRRAERKRRSEWGSRGFQRYWTWLSVSTADPLESSPHNKRLQSLQRMEPKRKIKCEQHLFAEHKTFLALYSAKSRRWNTAARRNSNCLQRDLMPVYSTLAARLFYHVSRYFQQQVRRFAINESKIAKSHTAKTKPTSLLARHDILSFSV